jgi:response regulator RpfG family c-di-GMP phosphodiesterase
MNSDGSAGASLNTDNDTVLIVSDSTDELSDLKRLLGSEFGALLTAQGESEGLRLFTQHHSAVLMLAFQQVGNA